MSDFSYKKKISYVADYVEMSRRCAEEMADCLRKNPRAVFCLATGATPKGAYRIFADKVRREKIDVSGLRVIALDEWVGLPPTHPSTCRFFLETEVTEPLGLSRERFLVFQSDAADPDLECRRIREELERWGEIDLAVLGVGRNGHIGLNEPQGDIAACAHVATLSATSRSHDMLTESGGAVCRGMTLGFSELLGSKRAVLMFSGKEKADSLARFQTVRLTTESPVTLMHLHRDLLCLADRSSIPDFDRKNE